MNYSDVRNEFGVYAFFTTVIHLCLPQTIIHHRLFCSDSTHRAEFLIWRCDNFVQINDATFAINWAFLFWYILLLWHSNYSYSANFYAINWMNIAFLNTLFIHFATIWQIIRVVGVRMDEKLSSELNFLLSLFFSCPALPLSEIWVFCRLVTAENFARLNIHLPRIIISKH